MALLVVANLTNVMANFAGVATALELFHVSRYVSVPMAAVIVWLLVVKGTYASVEKIFPGACITYIAYIVAAVVEKGITVKDYAESRIEVIVGCIVMVVVAFFIIVACAAGIWEKQLRGIESAADAAKALRPFGEYAFLLFSAGLLNASLFAASIQPLSTAYSVCEGLGFESGVNKRFRMIKLVNNRDLMHEWTNPRVYNCVAWAPVVILIALTSVLVGITVRDMYFG